LQSFGLGVDLETSHPKMGLLVREAAEHAAELRAGKNKFIKAHFRGRD
jgi:hypothetical protein